MSMVKSVACFVSRGIINRQIADINRLKYLRDFLLPISFLDR